MQTQTQQIMENIKNILEASGSSLSKVVRCNVFLTVSFPLRRISVILRLSIMSMPSISKTWINQLDQLWVLLRFREQKPRLRLRLLPPYNDISMVIICFKIQTCRTVILQGTIPLRLETRKPRWLWVVEPRAAISGKTMTDFQQEEP